MLIVALQILFSTICTLALCMFVGWGPARLGLPATLRPYAPLLAPLLGYAIAMWAGYIGVSTILNLRWSLGVLLLAATALNTLAWRRTGPPHITALREHSGIVVVFALALLAGIWPLLQYGYPTVIGRGWDPETYLPMAQYLTDFPLAQIGSAPANPLRDLVRNPPRIALTLGFSVLHGFTMILSNQTALDTYAPVMALLRAFGVLAIYIWLRACMGLDRISGLLAATLTAAGSLMLWVAFFNFGMQIASWPLIGLGLTLGLAAVEQLSERGITAWPVALTAGIALAALPVAYYPVLTIFGPMAVGLGLARAIEAIWPATNPDQATKSAQNRWPSMLRLLLASIALGLITLVFAAPTISDYFKGFAFQYSLVAQAVGPDRFISLTDILGLTTFRLEPGGDQPPQLLVWAALAAVTIMAIAACSTLASRRWLLVLLPFAAYLAWLRYGRPYEYAYMKSSAYAGMALWGVLLFGWQQLATRLPASVRRPILVVLIALPLAATLWAQAITLADHGSSPALFGRDLVALETPVAQIPSGATVLISADERFVGPNNGLIASILYGRELWGRISTAYFGLNRWPVGGTPAYALLQADEPAWPLDLAATEIWRSKAAALYRLDPQRAILLGRSRLHIDEPPTNPFSPAAMAIWRRAGPTTEIHPETPLQLLVGDDLRFGNGEPSGQPSLRTLTLTLAALEARQLTIRSGSISEAIPIPPGISSLLLTIQAPVSVQLSANGQLALISATAQTAGVFTSPTLQPHMERIAWSANTTRNGEQLTIGVQHANPGNHALRAEITVIEDTFQSPKRLVRTLAALPIGSRWQLNYVPARGALEAIVDGKPTALLQVDLRPDAPDGSYFGVLALYSGEEIIARAPLFTMQLANGKITAFEAVAVSTEAASAGVPAHTTANQRALLTAALALDGQPAVIEQVILARQPAFPGAPADAPFAPGDQLTAQIFWHSDGKDIQPLAISIQVIGPNDRKVAQWDGPAGGEWQPSQSWSIGERIRQDVPLRLDPATPSGSYRLLLIAYDPSNGTLQLIAGQQAVNLGEISVR